MRTLSWIAIGCALGLIAVSADARIRGIRRANGHRTFAPSQYLPLYPGDNELRLRGQGVDAATAILLPPGIADSATVHDKSVDASGIGEITARIRIKPTVHGKVIVRLAYPDGNPPDTFKARVFRKGHVDTIHAPASALVGQPIHVAFSGQNFGVAALRNGGRSYQARRTQGSDDSARFEVTFSQCGTLHLTARAIHDAQVPVSEVVTGDAGYHGSPHAAIVVTAEDGKPCPAAAPPPGAPFCDPRQRWDDTQAACVPR